MAPSLLQLCRCRVTCERVLPDPLLHPSQVFVSVWYVDHLATVQVLCDLFLRADVSSDNALDFPGTVS